MSLSPPGDLYFGLDDAFFHKMLGALQQQRPSLLNYVTPYFAQHPDQWCNDIPAPSNGAPRYTAIPGFSVGGSSIPPVECVLQVNDIGIGFGIDTVGLPTDMLPLPPQRIALKISINLRMAVPKVDPLSIGCPGNTTLSYPLHLCDCFNATVFATATATIIRCGATSWITFAFDRIESTNLTPSGLSQSVDYLAVLLIDTMVVPNLWVKLAPFVIDLSKSLPPSAPIKTITITPSAPTANPNPDISSHVLKARFNLSVTAP